MVGEQLIKVSVDELNETYSLGVANANLLANAVNGLEDPSAAPVCISRTWWG